MSQLVVNDLFDELKRENTRLANQLSFANQCLKLLNECRTHLSDFSRNCYCRQNLENKLKCAELECRYNQLKQKSVIDSEHSYSFAKDIINSPKPNENKTLTNISAVVTTGGKNFVVFKAKQLIKVVTNDPKVAGKSNNNAIAVKDNEKQSALTVEDLNLSEDCVKNLLFEVNLTKSNTNVTAVKDNAKQSSSNTIVTSVKDNQKQSSLTVKDLDLSEDYLKNLLNEVNKTKQTNSAEKSDAQLFKCDQTNCLASFYKLAHLKRHKQSHQSKVVLNFEALDKRTNAIKPNKDVEQNIEASNSKKFVEYKFEALDNQTKVIKLDPDGDNDSQLMRCFQCNFTHKSETVFGRHYDMEHKLHKCPYCDKQFRYHGYKAHIRNIHVRKMCVCDKCGKTFSRKNFLRHSRIHSENSYKCDFNGCTYETNNMTNLRSHKLIHKPKPINCHFDGCTRKFYTNSHLNQHYKVVHGNQRRFECSWPECSAKFKYMASLTIHVRSKHTGEKPYECDWPDCGSKFGCRSQQQFHYKVVHMKLKKFVCDWPACNKSFSLSSNLRTHMRVHLNQRNFKCDYPHCEKSYYSSDKLKRHKKIHN